MILGNWETDDNPSIFDRAQEIRFLPHSQNYCVCFVDLVNSTKITAEISDQRKIGQYYSIFINTMAVLVKHYGAKIVKNVGDALIFYFPGTLDARNETAFQDVLECLTTMLVARNIINAKLRSENLPSVSYRISADYGKVEVATSTSSRSEDLFGSTMNICAKINSMAEPNGIVMGEALHQIIRSFSFADEYQFKELQRRYSIGFSERYPVYCVFSNNISKTDIGRIKSLFRSRESAISNDLQINEQSQVMKPQQRQKYSYNILVVDDEPDTAFTYKTLLSAEGYDVQVFTDPQEALKHFVQRPDPSSHYQLVLLDIRMPRLNGLQLFYRIKAVSPNTKIVFCSALDIAEELTSILPGISYHHIIKKPMRREDFISKINAVINNHPVRFDSLSV
ncbi:MAG TPA: response regulator [Nitrososphaeraceae archaeon]|nr:response regulator [Nitrososphaeraceae archaeon]